MLLYKYCDKNGLRILQDLAIKVSPPCDFNDPFEFLPTAQEKFSRDWAKKQIAKKSIQNKLRIQFKRDGFYKGKKYDFKKFIQEHEKFVLDYVTESYPQAQIWICRGLVDFYSKHFGVFCLSQEPLNILMWSHYAHNHEGIVIEFDFSDDPEKDKIYKVRYTENRIQIPPSITQDDIIDANIFAEIALTKSKDWAYENEYRITYEVEETKATEHEGKTILLKDIDPHRIKRILFGVSCPSELIVAVKNELKKPELSHVKTEQVYLDHYFFRLRLESEFKTEEERLFIAMK